MKHTIQRLSPAFFIVLLPIVFLWVSCKDKMKATADSPAPERTNAVVADTDNSRKNIRDREDATLTPGDQGTTSADREVTQKIRKALVIDASGYSTTAKNIKIITVNGKTTLRGPVNTEAEKTGIVALAKTVAGDGKVEDQLEVKTNP